MCNREAQPQKYGDHRSRKSHTNNVVVIKHKRYLWFYLVHFIFKQFTRTQSNMQLTKFLDYLSHLLSVMKLYTPLNQLYNIKTILVKWNIHFMYVSWYFLYCIYNCFKAMHTINIQIFSNHTLIPFLSSFYHHAFQCPR